MNVLVFGATGPLGRCLADRLLSAGHQVTAFVRSPGRLGSHPGLHEVTGDVLDVRDVAAAIPGHDAVISALGHSRPSPAGRDLHPGTSHIIEGMRAAGVSRLIWISSHSGRTTRHFVHNDRDRYLRGRNGPRSITCVRRNTRRTLNSPQPLSSPIPEIAAW